MKETHNTEIRRGETSAPVINVTPFIDILLVLLIIFMVVTPLRPARFKTLVPEPPPEDVRVLMSPRTLVVEVEGGGRVVLWRGSQVVAEGTVEQAGGVAARVEREWQERKAAGAWKAGLEARTDLPPDLRIERTVFVRAPRTLAYGPVARVVDHLKGAGADPVGLQTDGLPD
ncbi:MAG TPA: biopolymer transporter ExbD [Pyrinomonadaceae bacterium]|nr:biopolymer transporter ExbD [Pyrinomonadaceae bacterium]